MRYSILLLVLSVVALSTYAQNPAINFDGTDDYIQTSFNGISGKDARTVEAWIRTTANCDPSTGGKQKIITDWGSNSTGERFTMNIMRNQALRLEVNGSGLNGQTAINDGYWHHVAVVYDPNASNPISLYVDGTLDTAGTIPTSINTGTSVDMRIGLRVDNANSFEGDIDEVRVFNYARTDSAIKADMFQQLCNAPSGLVAYYRLDEGNPGANNSSKKTATESISSKHGTLTNFNLYGSSSNWISGSNAVIGKTGDTLDVLECYEYTSSSGKTYSSTGTYFETFTNSKGCDSILTINLKVGRSYAITYPSACDSFTLPSGQVVYNSGTYRDTLFKANSVGCDSIRLTILTLQKSTTSQESMTSCDSIEIDQMWYYQSLDVDKTLQLPSGCDSVHTIHVHIDTSSQFWQSVTTCDTFYSSLGNTYTQSGLYTDILQKATQFGCDSVIYTDLTIHQSVAISTPVTACDSFTSPGGITYLKSGVFDEFFQTSHGCDSVISYDITVNTTQHSNLNQEACDSAFVNHTWYFTTQLIQFADTTTSGCDSLVEVDLTVTTINHSVSQNGDQLEALEKNADYQWFNCSTQKDVPGATADVFTPTSSGNYAVRIQKNSCEKTSECTYVQPSSSQILSNPLIRLYPNPSSDQFVLEVPPGLTVKSIQVYDHSGRVIGEFQSENNQVAYNHQLPDGHYLIFIETSWGVTQAELLVIH
ncbi:MAG: T9SS type A sorting domain-containing protein [Bacteroidetes bacterium]|nr:T9SS type A sorting domain-containing protein [Bacteroidota bacterium]